jgi:hypothetical protein
MLCQTIFIERFEVSTAVTMMIIISQMMIIIDFLLNSILHYLFLTLIIGDKMAVTHCSRTT